MRRRNFIVGLGGAAITGALPAAAQQAKRLPVVKMLGVDPVHFGMIMMVNLGIGLITPPVGTVLFVGSAVSRSEEHTSELQSL